MRIQEVERAVGITKKNIRFYEEQGLLAPRHEAENGYRDYGEADVDALLRVKLLRSLDVPIEEIRRLQTGALTLEDCLRRHEISLERRETNIERMKEMCAAIREEGAQYATVNAAACFQKMEQMESEGVRFMDVKSRDRARKLRGSLLGGGAMIVLMLAAIALGIAAYADGMPAWGLAFFLGIPAIVIVGIAAALMQRIKEIERGEEDEAAKY